MSTFTDNIISIHGDAGQRWLDELDNTVANLAKKWNLRDLVAYDNLTFNYVLRGFQNDVPIVLKVGIRDGNLAKEAQTLQFFENHGAMKLIDWADGALLLQRAVPGNSLMEYFPHREEESIEIAADVIRKLHSISNNSKNFIPIEDLLGDFHKKWDIPDHFIFKAQCMAEHLLKTTTRRIIMHGDLHHDNILRNGDGWKIIDPVGMAGDPAYEIASFMLNPIDKIWKCENAATIIKNRIEKFSALLAINPRRIAQWTFVKSVLCWIWTLETPHHDRSQLAKLFDGIVDDYI
ncbi:MAG: aminoglycoside phosphotransferase family protein [Holosporaceae bacterium]|nr:aminoglycoside phosphotransferase family protein [Holosporaceae bacterium]